jgi:hypothetical protein
LEVEKPLLRNVLSLNLNFDKSLLAVLHQKGSHHGRSVCERKRSYHKTGSQREIRLLQYFPRASLQIDLGISHQISPLKSFIAPPYIASLWTKLPIHKPIGSKEYLN